MFYSHEFTYGNHYAIKIEKQIFLKKSKTSIGYAIKILHFVKN